MLYQPAVVVSLINIYVRQAELTKRLMLSKQTWRCVLIFIKKMKLKSFY